MTFRSRLVMAAAVAVAIAVLLAAAATFFASRNAVINSVDDLLKSRADGALVAAEDANPPGLIQQQDFFPGDVACVVVPGGQCPNNRLPVSERVYAVAAGKAAPYWANVTINGQPYREYVSHIPPGFAAYGGPENPAVTILNPGAALLLATPLTGVNNQLTHLGLALALVVVMGIALAILLGWLVARTTLVPVNDLTSSVEDIAQTLDVTRRLPPGGPDELGRLRRAFNRLLAALETSQDAQRRLVQDASHELRTPLTSLRTNLEVVRRIDELPAEDREVLVSDVLAQLEELTNIVGDLAELARGEPRREEAALLRLDLLVEDAVALATTHGRSRGVMFDTSVSPTWVVGHRDRLAHAVGNLLDNAIKWSPDGGTVEVTCQDGLVTVRDHGPGISPEDLPHIFNRFYRSRTARALPGSGLGLAIVAQVAGAEGGSVEAAAAEGGGAVLRLQLHAVLDPDEVPVED
ncbi:MAG TPA: HAMP domain-containing sensor histidine kinase [Acidimicrobiales bacterium]|nr:HAMP domain-containing sensor histidine kinase [Acidimicrobiales bacterium]